jgi:hypothetical protein
MARWRIRYSQWLLAIAAIPPATTPTANEPEMKSRPQTDNTTSRIELPIVRTAKKLFSSIFTGFTVPDFFSDNYIYITKGSYDTDKKKNKEENIFRAEPIIQKTPEKYADGYGQNYGDTHTGYNSKGLQQVPLFFIHQLCPCIIVKLKKTIIIFMILKLSRSLGVAVVDEPLTRQAYYRLRK